METAFYFGFQHVFRWKIYERVNMHLISRHFQQVRLSTWVMNIRGCNQIYQSWFEQRVYIWADVVCLWFETRKTKLYQPTSECIHVQEAYYIRGVLSDLHAEERTPVCLVSVNKFERNILSRSRKYSENRHQTGYQTHDVKSRTRQKQQNKSIVID